MLLKEFEVGKRYRFNKELLLKYIESMGWSHTTDWADEIHLQEVTIIGDTRGYVGDYIISPEWCEEIVVAKPLKTRDDIKDMYKQVLYLEELEELIHYTEEAIFDSQLKYNFIEFLECQIERIKKELGLGE